MSKTTTDTRSASSASDQIDAVVDSAEGYLMTKLEAGGPLLTPEAPSVLAEFQRIHTALRLALTQRAVPDDLTDDPQAFAADFVRDQLAKEADVLVANAEARASRAFHAASDQWRSHLDNEARKQRWARVQQGQGGRR